MKAGKASYAGVILVLTVLLIFAACRGKKADVPSAAESSAASEKISESIPQSSEAQAAEETEAVSETTQPAVPEETTAREEDSAADTALSALPTDTAEIVQMYNDAINRAVDSTAPFTKTREIKAYQSSVILAPFKTKIHNFMGIGQPTKTRVIPQEVDYDHYLQHADLTASDVESATCSADADGNYRIDLHIVKGESYAAQDGGSSGAPLDKSGIAVGERDKSYWDHKTAPNIYASMEDVIRGVRVDERYDDAFVTAVVHPDGSLESVHISFHVEYDLSYAGLHGAASLDTDILFDRFSIPKDRE